MTRIVAGLGALMTVLSLACSQSTPPIDTPATLPPAEPPADVTRGSPDSAAPPEPKEAPKPVTKP